ncbi:uncharacterized protein LOC110901995 [Helianthus annuus]|uniref:uncharacterized protein LOC110901995 n=1 Tax=Helianthus annuus TaxID=4232 RepID=UPI000B8FBD37|nr:uncharacterized protein LOC110901995 [Helianthus annuus]
MKQHLASLPDIATLETGELIFVYLSVAGEAIRAVLTIERDKVQVHVYFFSNTLKLAEIKYPPLEKLALALVQTARRLRRKAIKAQVLADFIVEVLKQTITEVNTAVTEPSDLEAWKLFIDGASSVEGSGAGFILINPEGLEFTYALRFEFQITNNEAEYEALIAGLRLAKEMKVQKLQVFIDSLLVSSQVNDSYVAKEPNTKRYKEKSKELMNTFQTCTIKKIPRILCGVCAQSESPVHNGLISQGLPAGALEELSVAAAADTQVEEAADAGTISREFSRCYTNALSKLASLTLAHLTKKVLVEVLKTPSIEELEVQDVITEEGPNWMTPIKKFLKNGELPADQTEAERVKIKSKQYVLQGEILYKKGYLSPLSRCVVPEQSQYLVKEVHEGICGAHFGARTVVAKLMNLGYFWPSMHRDAAEQLRKCEACQIHALVPKSPKHDLVPISSAWPFHKRGMDIVGPFPPANGGVKFLLVAIDYFVKWPEVKPLAKITALVQMFSLFAYPQSNGQVERTNQSIVEGIKMRLGRHESNWLEELPNVLWAIRTTEKTSHKRTPYSLVFGSEAVIPAEIGVVTQRTFNMDPEVNNKEAILNLQLLEETRDQAAIQETKYKQKMEAYYNTRVKHERFKPGETLCLETMRLVKKKTKENLAQSGKGDIQSSKHKRADPTS